MQITGIGHPCSDKVSRSIPLAEAFAMVSCSTERLNPRRGAGEFIEAVSITVSRMCMNTRSKKNAVCPRLP